MSNNVEQLALGFAGAATPTGVPTGKKHLLDPLTRQRNRYTNLSPEQITRLIMDAERGILRPWVDYCEWMLRFDGHIRAVCRITTNAIVTSPFTVEPASPDPLDVAAAKACDAYLRWIDNYEELTSNLLHAKHVGFAAAQHDWKRDPRSNEWRSIPELIPSRDIELDAAWRVMFRPEAKAVGTYADEEPDRWIVHFPGDIGIAPHLAGSLWPVAWLFLIKRLALVYWAKGAERLGNGIVVGKVPGTADKSVSDALLDRLNRLTTSQSAVFEAGTEIELHEPGSRGEVWEKLIDTIDADISKAIILSTLLLEVQSTGGNRSLGDNQFATGLLPAWKTDARKLSGAIERGMFAPFLKFNAGLLFGGRVPRTPRLSYQIGEGPDPANRPSWDLAVGARVIKKNDLRGGLGLSPLTPEEGGDQIAEPAQVAAPGAFGAPVAAGGDEGGGAAVVPLHQTSAAMSAAHRRNLKTAITQISSLSARRLAAVPFPESDDRAS